MDGSPSPSIAVNSTFNSWTEFQFHFKKWCLETNVEFVVSSSKTVEWANRRLLGPKERQYGDQLKYKYCTFVCKQSKGKPSESTGKRSRQR